MSASVVKVPSVSLPPSESQHKLQHKWSLWYTDDNKKNKNYEERMHCLGSFDSAETFWQLYSNVIRPSQMPIGTDYHLFKHGVRPMWEDDFNKRGGKVTIRIRKSVTNHLWERMVLSVIGEQLTGFSEEISGCVVSVRAEEDAISLWHRTASDLSARQKIDNALRMRLGLPETTVSSYTEHDKAYARVHKKGKRGGRGKKNFEAGREGGGEASP